MIFRIPKQLFFILLLILPFNLTAQFCSVEGQPIKYHTQPGIEYTLSHGFCYHYNSTTFEAGYKRHLISTTFMNRNLMRSTPRMQDEVYLGYTYLYPVNRRLRTGVSAYAKLNGIEPVGRFFIDYKIYKPLYLHGSIVQVNNRMTHLIGGLKIVL